ncbi:MLX-interacting protein-like isoform X1, partial [Biomphalaria pfeifferi]
MIAVGADSQDPQHASSVASIPLPPLGDEIQSLVLYKVSFYFTSCRSQYDVSETRIVGGSSLYTLSCSYYRPIIFRRLRPIRLSRLVTRKVYDDEGF